VGLASRHVQGDIRGQQCAAPTARAASGGPASCCSAGGVRPTAQQADDIYTVVRAEIGAISRQAVYDTLAALTDKGLFRRIQPAGSSARYENRVGDNHHHLICRICNRMVDVDCAVGSSPCLTAADDAGYEIDEAEVVYWGRCPECVGATASSGGRKYHVTGTEPSDGNIEEEEDRRVSER
jgi:Fe2+ or Zn2+ uptake regulation protein